MAQTELLKFRVPWEQTCWSCSTESLDFECTDELTPLDHFIGQPRALEAIRFGLEVDKPGYNLFVTGLTGTGKNSAIKAHLQGIVEEMQAKDIQKPISDWCYIHDFDNGDRPRVLRLPQGIGRGFRDRLNDKLKVLQEEIPKVFKSEEYETQHRSIEEEGRQATQNIVSELEADAQAVNFSVQLSPSGMAIFPMQEGKSMTGEEYQQLDPERKKNIDDQRTALMQHTQDKMAQIRDVEKDTADKISALERVVADHRVCDIFQDMLDGYRDIPAACEHITRLIDYALDNLNLFKETEAAPAQPFAGLHGPVPGSAPSSDPFLPFRINVLVDASNLETVPIIVESNPSWGNLFGRIERRAVFGTYVSDHTMLKPGSVHSANGGYLVLNARDMLTYPGVWEGLKRVIRNGEIRLEDPSQQGGFFVPQGMQPEPIPVELKVIITGDEGLYRMFTSSDYEDFWDLFKVKAEFDYRVDLTPENLQAYYAFICRTCKEESLLPFDASGATKVVEFAARQVSDQTKLSTRFGQIKDLLIEADYWARKECSDRVLGKHIGQAVHHKTYRLNLMEDRIQDMIADGTLLLNVTGTMVGQVNGLSVYDLGDFSFGKPSRITAQTYAGRSGIINIEREVALSGRTHDKGVLILSGYLGAKFGQNRPLTLSVSLAFEQSYEGIDGDSASSTELYAILSSLSGLPLKQNLAVTGSVNQMGEIQPIGGVNQKIEGMFDVCRIAGLTGDQGVMIPHQNIKNLMLRDDVVEAVREGKFHIYSVKTIDEGIEILTGCAAGERRADGTFDPGTVNQIVEKRLLELNESMRGYYGALISDQG